MDLNRLQEANALIQGGVQLGHPKVMCRFNGLDQGELWVGHYSLWIELHAVCTRPPDPQPTGRHAITVRSENRPQRLFRETSEGWFSFERIVAYILDCLQFEVQNRKTLEAKRLARATAENQAQQLSYAHRVGSDSKVKVASQEACLEVLFHGLSYEQARTILSFADAQGLIRPVKVTEVQTLWGHLQEEDL